MMSNILEEICRHKLLEVRNRKKLVSLDQLCHKIKCHNHDSLGDSLKQGEGARNFFLNLQKRSKQKITSLICEIKKASPSAGLIRKDFDHVKIAKSYENAGASCISVLTDEKYFMGSHQYLSDVRKVVDLPLLCKDFIVDNYQIYEAKALGADCILLIVAMLEKDKLLALEECALSLDLSVLIEVHDEDELDFAMSHMKSKLIGINNRNLKTMKTDLNTSIRLAKSMGSAINDYVIVGESGIKTLADIELLKSAGIYNYLVGESLMRQENIEEAVKKLL